jgi:hypothetical protein
MIINLSRFSTNSQIPKILKIFLSVRQRTYFQGEWVEKIIEEEDDEDDECTDMDGSEYEEEED